MVLSATEESAALDYVSGVYYIADLSGGASDLVGLDVATGAEVSRAPLDWTTHRGLAFAP